MEYLVLHRPDDAVAPMNAESEAQMSETEIQRLQREIAERQARLRELVLGDPRKGVGFASGVDPSWTCSGMANACDQDEGA